MRLAKKTYNAPEINECKRTDRLGLRLQMGSQDGNA